MHQIIQWWIQVLIFGGAWGAKVQKVPKLATKLAKHTV